MPAVLSTDYSETEAYDGLVEAFDSESSYIYFPDVEGARLVVESIGNDGSLDLAFRVALCYNACEGVPNQLVAVGKLVDASQYDLLVRQRDELLALAVRSEFELVTCADRGAGDVDHKLIPDLRAMIAKVKGDSDGIEN